ncbi:MAG: efflux RND transporter periplasmic adaptor subunit [Halieaceae bacterium]|jgi:RND family efflux transporter MFP subunit|nr:efflux RND transporter periplasmic adaptor subunit [Halieaceae bacterium]
MPRVLKLLRPIAIIAVAAVIAVVMVRNKPQIESRQVEVPLPIVDAQLIELRDVPVTVVAYGNVAARRQLDLAAQVGGRILWKADSFEPGEVVEAGTLLLRIDDTDYRLALAEARQSLTSARLALADAKALRQAARVDEAEATVAAAEARIARAERDLANTEISAPYRAVIDEQAVEEGQFITIGTRLGRILGADSAEIRLSIPPQDIAFIDAGRHDEVRVVSSDASVIGEWTGRVKRVEARLDAQTRVFSVVVEVDNPLDGERHGSPLRFGQFVRTEIFGGTVANSVVIPQAALHGDDDVFLFEDGKLVRRSVEVGRISDGGALVISGLSSGERVVSTRLDLMFEGMEVALRNG